jgi:hypothetical protein
MGTVRRRPEAKETEAGVMEGTRGMGYWEFKKEICTEKGWQLRRIDPQTYEVIDSKHGKLGVLKSGEGFFPNPEAVDDAETPPEKAQ